MSVPSSVSDPPGRTDRAFSIFAAVLSVVALSVIGWLLLGRRTGPGGSLDLRFMPSVNAALNATSAVMLASAWVAVRRRKTVLHRYLTVSAGVSSTLFLVGYLLYHYAHGDTKYAGTGPLRTVYLLILASHVLLSATVVPGALFAYYFAFQRRFERHRSVTRWLMPVWLYVSVTGVVVFFMLRGSLPSIP